MIKTLHFCLLSFFSFFFLIPSVTSQKDWELLNPRPAYRTGKVVQFVSPNVGYIINAYELLETLDAGASWKKKQNINSGNDLKFKDNIGFIVGNFGVILKSTDSGSSWKEIYTDYEEDFNTVNIIDANTVIISGENFIIKSFDGGITWKKLNVTKGAINKTFFTSELVGSAACNYGTMLKTVDGGLTWYTTMTSNISPSNFYTVYFINKNIGFASREHYNLYKTVDGGETWTEIPKSSDALYTFSFVNENVGYAGGDHGVIFKTIDGGLNWTWAGFQQGRIYNTSIYGIHFLDANTGFATGARGRIIKTIDGGKTWTENSPTYNDVNKLDFLTKDLGYAQVGNSFYKTSNAGKDWALVGEIDYDRYHSVSTFKFLNENIGYAATGGTYGGAYFKTTDGGVTWNMLIDVIDEGINAISLINENVAYISGGYNQEKVMKTVDGGQTWEQCSNHSFAKMQFLDENTGYAHNYYDKKFYKTIDGGKNWSVVFSGEEDVRSMDFIDAENGYFLGYYGTVYKTSNGGKDWIQSKLPYGFYTFLKFYSKNIGYIVNEDGYLYKTDNGGIIWEKISTLENTYETTSISINGTDIYLAAGNGKILKSKVDFKPFSLQLNPASDVFSRSATLSGSVASNEGSIENIRVEYFYNSIVNTIKINPNNLNADSSVDFKLPIKDLLANKDYYFRIVISRNNVEHYSELLTFKTELDYKLIIEPIYYSSAGKAAVAATAVSYQYNISGLEFQYSTKEDFSSYEIILNNTVVKANTTEKVTNDLINLKPLTKYYVRLKAVHQGEKIYSEITSFTTITAYEIYLLNPTIQGNDVTLNAFIQSNSKLITNIVFEYGTLNYENSIVANPNQIAAESGDYLTALLSNLDPDKVYFYRVKALSGSEIIYSKDAVLNLSGKQLLTPFNIGIVKNNSVQLNGLVTSSADYFSNIEFEYGTTENFGTTVRSSPSFAYPYSTLPLNAIADNLINGQKYYYRIKANIGNDIIYSETLSFTANTLGLETPIFKSDLKFYPNPTNGIINIDSFVDKNINSIKVMDQTGKLLNYINPDLTGVQKIDLSGKSSGIYFIKVQFDDDTIIIKKVILK
ncbi:YCF48-related protein [Flavobacterium sp. MMLR14_040]|uniref:T9SS type A sorting domain-containing protein n=1 Tax=Flavobacterium sp. MMLR14_040 TaxID=3093843 RepID=UPI00298F53C7|nr:YCF48-related protein [Flavobacterium sp. MMLR14_040]MDW8850557.1 YCF48-related protein [Flavobacterium sp. MMLR14_040]